MSSPLEITPPPLATPPVNFAPPAAPEVIPARPSAPLLAIEKSSATTVTIGPASVAPTTARLSPRRSPVNFYGCRLSDWMKWSNSSAK
ncbi:MAG: hypothetical protein U0Y68_26295 [Blastocatellia bacterium]